LRHSRCATTPFISSEYVLGEGDLPSKKRKKAMSIRSTLIVAAAIATLGLGSPAFAASYGGLSNDTGNMRPSYYDKNGWHVGLPPEARPALAAPQQQSARTGRGLHLYAGSSRGFSGIAHPVPGANGPAASNAGAISDALQNDWFWGGSRY
jgi:hypothetical protein